jgi:hypothetical protein
MKIRCIFILLLISISIYPDSIYLSNGNLVTGEIISLTEDVIKIKTKDGILEVDKNKIVRGEFLGQV